MRVGPSMLVVILPVIAGSAMPGSAQERVKLPAICMASAAGDMGSMKSGSGTSMDAAHADLVDGMDDMNMRMMAGAGAPDIDVAFVCAMIAHHEGAIDMAKAELAHGDNQWARGLAQNVIDAQEKEIAEMLTWLDEQATR